MIIYKSDLEKTKYFENVPVRQGCIGPCACLGICQNVIGYVNKAEYEYFSSFHSEKEIEDWIKNNLIK
jgi:hypothetical protein